MTATALALLITTGCGVRADAPPEIVVDRTSCNQCRMLISEPVYAAAYQVPGQAARVFDDIGCLRQAARAEGQTPTQFWFHDASDGTWIDGREAVLVRSPEIRTPMGGGLLAHRTRVAAEAAAARHRGRIVTLEELLKKEGL